MSTIKTFGSNPPPRDHFAPAADRILAGDPQQWVENYHDSADGKFSCGIWHGEPGRWRVIYTEQELCVILSGTMRLTGDDGSVHDYGPGARFVIPSGFTGIWENLTAVEKVYAIYLG